MKTTKISLQHMLLAAALALPLASHAANGLDVADDGYGAQDHGPRTDGAPGMPPGGAGGGHDGPRGLGGPRGSGGMDRGGPGAEFGPGPGPGPRGAPPFMHGLVLTEAQQDKVFALLHGEEPYIRDQSRALLKAREALHALGKADQYDDAKASSLAQAAAQAMANLDLQRVRTEQKLLAVLTPEQRKQLAQRRQPGHGQQPDPRKPGAPGRSPAADGKP